MTDALAHRYAEKDTPYFTGARRDIVQDLPTGQKLSVLEIGCGAGATGGLAKAKGCAARYVGIELDPGAGASARRLLDVVIIGNVESPETDLPDEKFDVVILSEVLEHLIDPWAALARITPLMKRDGLLYASSPNVAHISVIRNLLANRWDYTGQGRMDWTHMRWFTPRTYRQMMESAGLDIVWLKPTSPLTKRQKLVDALTFGALRHIFVSQIFVKARRL
jgi:SAM-dependent methyltransferase